MLATQQNGSTKCGRLSALHAYSREQNLSGLS
jgi:hypothetical protein